jgi:uncharacterized protein (TIGR02391 family)
MASARSKALIRLLDELESYKINLNHYYGDSEPQSVYDSHLSGKFDALALFCRRLGCSDLASQIQELVPLQMNAPEALTRIQDFVLPEIRHVFEYVDVDEQPDSNETFWQFLHPRIVALTRPRFEQKLYGDAVEACFKEVNSKVKSLYFDATGRESDGSGLMTSAFSPANPVIRLTDMATQSDRDEQQGYMQIFAGAMTGIRNPKAHANINPDSRKTLHLVALASLLMHRLDERI